ncbi:MAG: drug (bicyclomycin) resistance translocase, superfamily [Pseudomonadota bacterium]
MSATGSAAAGISASALALILAALAMLGPFSVDTYLPAFPAIQQSLDASALEVQQTLTAYMFSFAVMILWHGALSDAFGRRSIILMSLAVFAVASLACAAVHSVEYLWIFRMLQGISAGAGVVIGRAIIRDLYAGADAERMLSLVTMIFSISPAIAPVIGGWIVTLSNWRTIFLFLFVFTVCLLWLCYRLLPETLPIPRRQPFNPQSLWRNYRQIFGSSLFQLKAGAIAFNFSGLFIYVAAAPVLMTHHLGLGPQDFGWMFIPSVAGIFLGALAANRMAGRIQVRVQVLMGFALLMLSGVFNVGYHLFFPPVLFWTIAPLFFYTMGMSMVAPGLTLLVLDLFPHIRGTVASCQSFTMTMLSALVAGVIVPLLSDSVLWLAAGQFSFALIGLLLWLLGHRVGKIQRSIQ